MLQQVGWSVMYIIATVDHRGRYKTHVFMANSPFLETLNQASIVRMSPELIYDLFDSISPAIIPLNQPKGGTTYLYRWEDDDKKDDRQIDGYRWRQNGNCKFKKLHNGSMSKVYFQVCVCVHSVCVCVC